MKLLLAPMATLCHEAFRRTVERFGGCDEYFSEMIHAPSLVHGGPFEASYLQNGAAPHKMVWQLTSPDAESLCSAARIAAGKGGIGIDINMGCSAPQIYRTGAGIAWMSKPEGEVRRALRLVRKALDDSEAETGRHLRLSVKLRLGDEDATRQSFFCFTDMLAQEGVELFTLHARTKKEKFRGLPRYEEVEALALRHPDIPVVLNGAVSDGMTARSAMEAAPHVAGIMIGRAAAQKPWIFAALSSPEKSMTRELDAESLALGFISDTEELLPPQFHRTRLSRFFSYYCMNFSFAHYFATQMTNARTNEESRERVRDYFSREPGDRLVRW